MARQNKAKAKLIKQTRLIKRTARVTGDTVGHTAMALLDAYRDIALTDKDEGDQNPDDRRVNRVRQFIFCQQPMV